MSLIGEKRKQIILERVEQEGQISTSSFAEEMNVSTETIRQYLDELEAENKLKKVYGGAVKAARYQEEPPFRISAISHLAEKTVIAQEAARLIGDNDIVILDEGGTAYKLAEQIVRKKNLTVVTPSLSILSFLVEMELKKVFDGKIVLVGGVVDSLHDRVAGPMAEEFLQPLYAQKAFISAEGVDLEGGITAFDSEKAVLSRRLIGHAQEKYVLADHFKLGNRSFFKICGFAEISGVVCDRVPSQKWLQQMKKDQTRWFAPQQP